MPAYDPTSFSVPADPDALAGQDLLATVSVPLAGPDSGDSHRAEQHHGASQHRQAARERSGKARDRRAAGAGKARSYAFRRS